MGCCLGAIGSFEVHSRSEECVSLETVSLCASADGTAVTQFAQPYYMLYVSCVMYVRLYSFGPLSRAQPRPTQEVGLVPAIRDTGFPTPLAVRRGTEGW